MRHRNLVFATILGLFVAFTAQAQVFQGDSEAAPLKPELRGRKGDEPQVMGRITDIVGRSIRAAEVKFMRLDADEMITVRSNAFGYYQAAGLAEGQSYFVSVNHRKYLFLIPTIEVVAGEKVLQYDFLGEAMR